MIHFGPRRTINSFGSLGQLTKILRDSQQDFVMDKLIGYFSGDSDELRDVAGLGEPLGKVYSVASKYHFSAQDHHHVGPKYNGAQSLPQDWTSPITTAATGMPYIHC